MKFSKTMIILLILAYTILATSSDKKGLNEKDLENKSTEQKVNIVATEIWRYRKWIGKYCKHEECEKYRNEISKIWNGKYRINSIGEVKYSEKIYLEMLDNNIQILNNIKKTYEKMPKECKKIVRPDLWEDEI